METKNTKTCSVTDCIVASLAAGLCNKHYKRQRRWGSVDLRPLTQCEIEGCTEDSLGKSQLCPKHRDLRGQQTYKARHIERLSQRRKEPRTAKLDECREYERQWKAKWRKERPEENKKIKQRYYKKNLKKIVARNTKRKKHVKIATPKWADLKAIEVFYSNCPPGYHVDHIIPLKGKDVSGLHVLNNLQYLTAFENISKCNRIDLDKCQTRSAS